MLALVLTVPAGDVEIASDALWALGVVAIEERHGADDHGTDDRLVELWTSIGDDESTIINAVEAFPMRWRWRIETVDPAVAESWRSHARPSWITTDLVIVPAWVDAPDTIDEGTTVISIDPEATFGLGDHPSTILSLRALRATIWPGCTVLDVGCGSGVIAVTAALLGAGYVAAVDISPAAIATTARNAERNGVAAQIDAAAPPIPDERFDIVVANILSPTLVELADDLKRATSPSGVLIVAGLLADRTAAVRAALAPLHVVDELVSEGWSALVMRW